MTSFLLNNQRSIILISSLLGLGYSLHSIYERIVLAFDGIQDKMTELSGILYDLPFLIPALMGLLHFQSKNTSKINTPLIFSIYGLTMAVIILLKKLTTDALGFGLPMILIFLPICVIICFFLIRELLKK
jgi:hypothetical protein